MKFFLAYSQADREYAASLAAEMEKKGASVWLDTEAIAVGDSWEAALRDALNSSGATILLLPREGAKGGNNAIFEAGAAKALLKKVFVVARGPGDREFPSNIADMAIFDAENKQMPDIAEPLVRLAS
jgi:ABC-type branched-subunit amino acid transport system substrate-binding protein